MTVSAIAGSPPYNTRPSWKVERSPPLPRMSRVRKGPKARTWTAQEETQLLESRGKRLPYKRIAAQLAKSELACRLHYHQLTVARQRQTYARALSADESSYDVDCHQPAYSSIPIAPETPRFVHAQTRPANWQPLPSLASLLPVDHRRGTSLPRFTEACSCSACVKDVHDVASRPMLPPPQRLLSPFELIQGQSATPQLGSTWTSPLLPTHSHHRSTSFMTSTSTTGTSSWTPLSSRSSSISSIASFYHLSPPMSCESTLAGGERCSVRSILNHEGPSTI